MAERPLLHNSYAPLRNVSAMFAMTDRLLHRAHGLPGMGTFYGPAGFGKTTGGICTTNKFDACHIEVLPFGGVKGLLTMIVTELGFRPGRTVPDLFNQVAQELAKSGRPLLLDEADHLLSNTLIETVRRIHDVTGVPVILIGEEALPQKLQRWERVHSRMLVRVGAEPACLADVGHLAPIYAPGVEITDGMKAALLAASGHSIRNVATNLANLLEFAQLRGLRRVSEAEWSLGAAFHTGPAPAARRFGEIPKAPAAIPAKGRLRA